MVGERSQPNATRKAYRWGRESGFCIIDGTIFQGQHLIVAIGIERTGRKLVLGVRLGATENTTVVRALLGELAERGVDFNQPRLYLVDGSKAIRAALYSYAGEAAFFQRCQVHKMRNVCEHLPQEQRPAMKFRMRTAYEKPEAAAAR